VIDLLSPLFHERYRWDSFLVTKDLYDVSLFEGIVYGLLFWWLTACHMVPIYCLISIGGVAFHISKPSEWPPLFGAVSGTWSVRQYWS
jgi:hypothetical protein